MIIKIITKINYSVLFFAISFTMNAQESTVIQVPSEPLSYDKEIALPFNTMTQRQATGSMIVIDVQEELKRDQGSSVGDAINGKVPGMFGGTNTWGTGGAAILVDGIRQTTFYINSLDLLEVESIVILKDALSKSLYGAQGDKGIILVNTKRGKVGKQKLRVVGDYRYSDPRALPKYLNAADYMSKYSEAQLNDGVALGSLRYPQNVIDATRNGNNPVRYPENDFYSEDYLKNNTKSFNVFADIAGGNEKVRYYVNSNWKNNNGWLNTPQADVTNRFNFRGNLDFEISDYLKMSVNTSSRFSFNTLPNSKSIWNVIANELPNNYPVLWDPNLITDETLRQSILSNAKLENGQLLGGNSSFRDNVYGNFTRNGNRKFMEREVQFGMKLDIDMRFLTKGLSAQVYGGMNFYNSLYTAQDPDFAVYEPIFNALTGTVDNVIVHGQDKAANKYLTNDGNSSFSRQLTYYGTLNYQRVFGKNAISATAILNANLLSLPDQLQADVLFHTGVQANYMFDKKYLIESSLMGIGSRKLKEGSRIEPALSAGFGWVISEEDFMPKTSFIDYLKLRTSYGLSKNDNWDNYFLYKTTYARGGSFNYENGISQNNETSLSTATNSINLQQRRDLTIGFDASLFKSMNIQFSYFKSQVLGDITLRGSTFPQILGYESLIYQNYNNSQSEGLELGLSNKFTITKDFSITAGTNILYSVPKITKREEAFYQGVDAELMRVGTASDAMWGLKSQGLYAESDFNLDGTLVAGLPIPSFGKVKPGDIKYLDQNSDNIIDNLDRRIIGHGQRMQYGLYLDMKYKDFEFYVLGIGSQGDSDYRSGSYFRVAGDVKYSEQANYAYGPNNKDVNAIHPRLSTTNVSNNNRDSDYWIFKKNSFTIPTIQLTYNFKGVKESSILKDSRVFFRANNYLVFGKNKEYTEINVGGEPRTKSLTMGIMASF